MDTFDRVRFLGLAPLHIPFTHAFSAFSCVLGIIMLVLCMYLETNVSTSKMQRNAENACGNLVICKFDP